MIVTEDKDLQEMIHMKINESFNLTVDIKVLRVPGGWIYSIYRTAVFVPISQ